MSPLQVENPERYRLERPEIAQLPKYNAGLPIEAVRSRYKLDRIAKLASNENPFGASPRALAALADMAALTASYPDGQCVALKKALSGFLGVPAARIAVGNGSENLIELACLAFLNPGERVVTADPCFGLHEIFARAMSAQVEKVPFDAHFQFDVPQWRRVLAKPAKIVMIANPSNPVGCRLDVEQFRSVIAAAPPDALLLIDEAYYEFAHGAGFPDSLAELARQERPWLVLRTFSKANGLAGLRVGYGIASSAHLSETLERVRTPFNVNAAAQAAAAAALADQEHVSRSVQGILQERAIVRRGLEQAGYAVAPSHTNFLFFDSGEPAVPLAERLLARGVIVKAWRDPGYERFVRVSVGSPADNEQFLAALNDVAGR
jgi:histidinol-phosphate aminotransferase